MFNSCMFKVGSKSSFTHQTPLKYSGGQSNSANSNEGYSKLLELIGMERRPNGGPPAFFLAWSHKPFPRYRQFLVFNVENIGCTPKPIVKSWKYLFELFSPIWVWFWSKNIYLMSGHGEKTLGKFGITMTKVTFWLLCCCHSNSSDPTKNGNQL